MAKSLIRKYAKKPLPSTRMVRRFQFPRAKAVIGVVSEAKHGNMLGVKKLKKQYDSAGYKIMGLTDDGIVIVRPPSKPSSFRARELRTAFSDSKAAAKSKRPSL
jgi:hypothetical protein